MAKKASKKEESGLPEAIKNTIDTLMSKGQKPLTIAQTLELPVEEVKKYLATKPSGPKAGTLMARNKKNGATVMTPAASMRGDESRVEIVNEKYQGSIHKINEE